VDVRPESFDRELANCIDQHMMNIDGSNREFEDEIAESDRLSQVRHDDALKAGDHAPKL
jgi:hypothetical protein